METLFRPGHRSLRRLAIFFCLAAPQLAPAESGNDQPLSQPFELELPSSPEIFRAASREAKPRWRQLYRATPKLPHRERNHSAFVLGTLLCETLIATEARDAQYVRNSVQDIRDCLTLLGLAEALDRRLPAIHEFAEGQKWPALRFEIEALEADFHLLLEAQMDTPLASLIGLGRQVRCLDACAAIAVESGHPVGIADPDYYAAVIRQIDRLSPAGKEIPYLQNLSEELGRLHRRWKDVSPGDDTTEDIAATAEKIRNFLNRIMGAER